MNYMECKYLNVIMQGVHIVSALMREVKAQKLLVCILCRLIDASAVEPNFSFHAVCYSGKLFPVFG